MSSSPPGSALSKPAPKPASAGTKGPAQGEAAQIPASRQSAASLRDHGSPDAAHSRRLAMHPGSAGSDPAPDEKSYMLSADCPGPHKYPQAEARCRPAEGAQWPKPAPDISAPGPTHAGSDKLSQPEPERPDRSALSPAAPAACGLLSPELRCRD